MDADGAVNQTQAIVYVTCQMLMLCYRFGRFGVLCVPR